MTVQDSSDKVKQVQVLDRMRKIFRTLADNYTPMSMHEIAKATGIHASTAHRLLWNLSEDGFVERNHEGNWQLGLAFLEYGNLVREHITVREKAIAIMQMLFEKTRQTINLSMRRGDHVMYIEHVYSPEVGVRLARSIGAIAPLHCTSGGKLFLSDATPEEVSAYIVRTNLRPRTPASINSSERLILELNRVKELGWAEDREELEHGVQCIGAPIRDRSGHVIAALTIASSTEIQHKSEWVRHLLAAANAISVNMGWLGDENPYP